MALSVLRLILFCVVIITSISCQQELVKANDKFFLLEKVEVFEGTGNLPVELYQYHYDSLTRFPSSITIDVPAMNYSRKVEIKVENNLIHLNGVGTIHLGDGRKISHLEVKSAFAGVPAGDYFYGYNVNGFLEERLYDDGDKVLERTVFANDGMGLTSFAISYQADPMVVSGKITYSGPAIPDNTMLQPYGDIFPELVPFFPFIKMGRNSPVPLERVKVKADRPGFPSLEQEYFYNAYQLNADNGLVGFESEVLQQTLPLVNKKIALSYILL